VTSSLRPPFPPQAVVLDLDGLLVDTEPRWEAAERGLIAALGGTWDPALRERLLGSGPQRAAAIIAEHLGGLDPQMIQRRMLVAALEEFRRGVPARPGAEDLLAALSARLPVAGATSSLRVLADTALQGAGLDGYLPVLICDEDVDEPKPSPQPYRRACAEFGADPERAVAFEDAPRGIASARAAGLWTVACPSVPGVPVDGAHAVIGSLTEVDVDALLAGCG
jgi:HAD superfamily hydrolase (TIGR01509 family)